MSKRTKARNYALSLHRVFKFQHLGEFGSVDRDPGERNWKRRFNYRWDRA